ncbi:MAG: hypothetical protein AMXMBFR82_30980 [Candidatus Hydrogenedentota bacterium]
MNGMRATLSQFRVVITVLVAVACVGIATVAAEPTDDQLAAWGRALESPDADLRANALGALSASGKPALPYLLQAADNPSLVVRVPPILALARIDPHNPDVQELMLRILTVFGLSDYYATELGKLIPPSSLPSFVNGLTAVSAQDRRRFEMALAMADPTGQQTVVPLLSRPETADRASGVRILRYMKPPPAFALQMLPDFLADPERQVQSAALDLYAATRDAVDERVLRALAELLADADSGVSERAARLMANGVSRPEIVRDGVLKALNSGQEQAIRASAMVISQYPEGLDTFVPAVPLLLQYARKNHPAPDGEIQRNQWPLVLRAILALAPYAPEAAQFAVEMMSESRDNPNVAPLTLEIVQALQKIGPAAASARDHVFAVLSDSGGTDDLRLAAAQALLEMEGPTTALLSVLEKMADTAGRDPRDRARIEALAWNVRLGLFNCTVMSKAIPSDTEGSLHFQAYLVFDGGKSKIPLARFYSYSESGERPYLGFDPASLDFRVVKDDELWQVSWDTVSQGSGHYLMHSFLLIQKRDGYWNEVFRHTGNGYTKSYGNTSSHDEWRFLWVERTEGITLEHIKRYRTVQNAVGPRFNRIEVQGGGHYFERNDVTIRSWPCQIENGHVKVLPGSLWTDLGETTITLEEFVRPDTQPDSSLSISDAEVATRIAKLTTLNPQLGNADVVSGRVLVETGIPPFEPWEGHAYRQAD